MAGALAALAVAIPTGSGSAQTEPPRYMAFGGGQYLFFFDPTPDRGESGGSTIAFSARQTVVGGAEADGELQDVDRTRVGGRDPVIHGTAVCMVVTPDGKRAIIDYRSRRDDPESPFHRLYVEDNGEGMFDDVLVLQRHLQAGPPCVPDPSPTVGGTLIRGNVQIEEID